ncbi:hypothetical protein [Demequina phytophila]|uniref:hypothetical protein n=1 Tax=Demequina phytophila TaxID=1638981 RepID=UPI0007833DD1|nr:hypothetical protein [Demequina phytophila]
MRRALLVLPMLALAACSPTPASDMPPEVAERFDQLTVAIDGWEDAGSIEEARANAEAARNLVMGAHGPLYGDGDEDGEIAGSSSTGLLPGYGGEPGLVHDPAVNPCVEADVLGGSWETPAARWDEVTSAIDAWDVTENTFPSLASHPQRIVGWATLTLETDTLDAALEYAGHARLHLDASTYAYEGCALDA